MRYAEVAEGGVAAAAVVAPPPAPMTPAAPRFALTGLSSMMKQPLVLGAAGAAVAAPPR